jgi:hypothetical protein
MAKSHFCKEERLQIHQEPQPNDPHGDQARLKMYLRVHFTTRNPKSDRHEHTARERD